MIINKHSILFLMIILVVILNLAVIFSCIYFYKSENIFSELYMKSMYTDILEKKNISKFDKYFTQDCYIEINGKVFTRETFIQRMIWLKKNTSDIKVNIINFFSSADGMQITDIHDSYSVDKNGFKRLVRVIQQSKIKNGKIKSFIDTTCSIKGDENLAVVTAN